VHTLFLPFRTRGKLNPDSQLVLENGMVSGFEAVVARGLKSDGITEASPADSEIGFMACPYLFWGSNSWTKFSIPTGV
jgi:hypothetical protein